MNESAITFRLATTALICNPQSRWFQRSVTSACRFLWFVTTLMNSSATTKTNLTSAMVW